MTRFMKYTVIALVPLVGACDFSGDFLFPGAIDGVPGVLHLTAEDGVSPLVPAVIDSAADARAATVYAEVGPTGDATVAGVTLDFVGNGGAVCAFVDPELVFWNQAVATRVTPDERRWRQPDNPFDDGDLDLQAGFSVYYTGSQGVELGSFTVRYEDTLGNEVPVDLVACTITSTDGGNPTAHGGRGAPEYCTIFNTQPGISYTVAMEVFSTPPDDDRLGFGVLLAEGPCPGVITRSTSGGGLGGLATNEECVITGEALIPIEGEGAYHRGYQEGQEWEGSIEFEETYCYDQINRFCNAERELHIEQGNECEYSTVTKPERRCYCGDPATTPVTGLGTF